MDTPASGAVFPTCSAHAAGATLLVVVGFGFSAAGDACAAPPQEPLNAKATLALVEELVLLDEYTAADRERRDALVQQLEALPPLDAKNEAKWRKTIDKLWADGPALEKKSGRHYLWPDDKRGLYIVGGRTKSPKGLVLGMHGGGAGAGDNSRAPIR